ncbi:unnamed protein product [Durusdinium trenchii]|uniref:Fe2OG dioxygenase domain-containing protein n=1 Tax=Durusdinium trenchii TaxID=1381693 RepID=A0ABP0NDH6_9DINO
MMDSKIRETLEEMAAECSDGGDGRPGACPLGQTVDDRSEKDGAGTEAIVAGQACGSLMAVTATEKSSTVFVYDISHIDSPSLLFVKHLSPASETKNPGVAYADRSLGEIDPEAMIFLDDAHSPSGKAGVMFGGAWSGTMSFWEFECPSTSESSGASGASLVAFLALVISDGTLWFFTSSKSAKIPFPFPYQNFVEVMLWLFTLMTPMVINGIVFEQFSRSFGTFCVVMVYHAVKNTGDVLEDPYLPYDPNDLPLVSLQVSLNTRLLAFGVIPTEEPEEEGEHPQKVAEKADVIQALPADDLAVTAVQFEVLVTEISSSAAFVVSDALHGWLAESRLRALPKRSIAGLCSSCRKPLPQEAFTRGARRRLRSGAAAACEACNKEARRQGAFGLDSLGSSWLPAICTLVGGSLVSVYLRPSMPLSLAIGSMLAAFCLKSWLFGWLGLGREPSLETKALRLVGEGSTAWSRCVDDAWVRSFAHLRRGAFTTEQLQRWWDAALNETHWRQPMLPNGRLLPRSAAWFVQPGCSCSYEYNGTAWPAVEVPKWLQEVEDAVWHLLSDEGLVRPNSCVANLYADGSQSVDWHADNEPLFQGLLEDCRIVSLSLGETRRFDLRRRRGRGNPYQHVDRLSIDLHNGDLITMEGCFQKHWYHRVPKAAGVTRPRINLTWRSITRHEATCPYSTAHLLQKMAHFACCRPGRNIPTDWRDFQEHSFEKFLRTMQGLSSGPNRRGCGRRLDFFESTPPLASLVAYETLAVTIPTSRAQSVPQRCAPPSAAGIPPFRMA